MSLGFQFTADLSNKDLFLRTVKELADQRGYSLSVTASQANVNFCRMGDLEFMFEPEEGNPEGDLILTADCVTSLAGAGFHAAAVDFIDALQLAAGLEFDIEDETEYYEHRSFQRMRQEHFYPWLTTLVDNCRVEDENASFSNFCVCWDLDQYVPEDIPGTVVTPVGRFHIAQLVDQIQNEGIELFAKEFFIWNEIEKDGRFYLNSALSAIWEDCCFMPGDRSKADRETNQSIIRMLEQAAALDPTLPMPKAEYELVCRLERHDPIDLSKFADFQFDYPLGYRRGKVVRRMGNTDITMPGNFLQDEDENSIVWYDDNQSGWRSLRASAFCIRKGKAEFSDSLFAAIEETPEEFKVGDGRCQAAFAGEIREEDETVYYQSIAQVICENQILLLTASYEFRSDADWAMSLFREIHSFRNVEVS